jgi:hypothetical protein
MLYNWNSSRPSVVCGKVEKRKSKRNNLIAVPRELHFRVLEEVSRAREALPRLSPSSIQPSHWLRSRLPPQFNLASRWRFTTPPHALVIAQTGQRTALTFSPHLCAPPHHTLPPIHTHCGLDTACTQGRTGRSTSTRTPSQDRPPSPWSPKEKPPILLVPTLL